MHDWLIIDGNNLIHARKDRFFARRGDFDTTRQNLVSMIDELAGELAGRVTIVFDGTVGGTDDRYKAAHLEIIYSPLNVTADRIIERLVSSAANPAGILVVTSDRAECVTVEGAGGEVLSCGGFVEMMDERRANLKSTLKRREKAIPAMKLGDFFPSGN